MKVIALTSFIHGGAEFKRGEVVEMQEVFAQPLIKARLLDPVIDSDLQDGGASASEPPEIDEVKVGSTEPTPKAPDNKPKAVKQKAAE